MSKSSQQVLREFSCSENPLDIFDGYVSWNGFRLRSSRRWFGQGPGRYGEWLNSKVVFQGVDLDYGDDPRPFISNGKICLLANIFTVEHGFRNHLIEFSSSQKWSRYFVMPPSSVSPGKNWSPFSFPDGRLGFVHSFSPLKILREVKREKGIILTSSIEAPGISVEEGDGQGFPAHRGGTNGVTIGNLVYGIGHTTKIAKGPAGNFVINPGCFYAHDRQLIHRPFAWCLDTVSLNLTTIPLDLEWDERYWIIDPTSLILEARKLELYTTEVERSFVDPTSAARTVRYDLTLTDHIRDDTSGSASMS